MLNIQSYYAFQREFIEKYQRFEMIEISIFFDFSQNYIINRYMGCFPVYIYIY